MRSRFSKKQVLALYCCCREAERSIDHALMVQWKTFTAYYDQDKQARILKLCEILKQNGAVYLARQNGAIYLARSHGLSEFKIVLSSLTHLIFNRFRTTWTFSQDELSEIYSVFNKLIEVIRRDESPQKQSLIDLRMDSWTWGHLIESRAIGLVELEPASRIEHFNQSTYMKHFSFEELGLEDCFQSISTPRDAA